MFLVQVCLVDFVFAYQVTPCIVTLRIDIAAQLKTIDGFWNLRYHSMPSMHCDFYYKGPLSDYEFQAPLDCIQIARSFEFFTLSQTL
jgi:hypothetical protein